MRFSTRKGFTLIELLVVVAIIGVLASVVLSALGDARAKARDARRVGDVKSIQTALEMYYLDHGFYPHPNGLAGGVVSSHNTGVNGWPGLEALMETTLPRDPVNSGSGHAYHNVPVYSYYMGPNYSTGCPAGQWYLLMWFVESYTVVPGERGGVERCNGGTLIFSSAGQNNSKGTGMSPAM